MKGILLLLLLLGGALSFGRPFLFRQRRGRGRKTGGGGGRRRVYFTFLLSVQ